MLAQDEETRFRIGGMDCGGCAAKVDRAVRRLPDVRDVAISVVAGTMTVQHARGANRDGIAATVRSLGYTADIWAQPSAAAPAAHADAHGHAHSHDNDHSHGEEGAWYRGAKAVATLVCAGALAVAFVLGQLAPWTQPWGFIAAMAVGLLPIMQRAVAAARAGSPFTIETLMSVAAVGAVIIGASEEAAVVVFLFLVGELLEGVAARRARNSIRALADLMPKTALVERDGVTASVPASALAVDDVILVRPGDRIAADGLVLSGETSVDEAPVTGESVPKPKTAGDAVFAGTVNADGVVRVRVTAAAADNTIARIIKLVEEAQEAKAPTERFIDGFSRVYTPAIMGVAALIAILPPLLFGAVWSEWIYKGLAVLLIGCPCALVISTPAAIAAALSAGARRGLLMKGGAVLENLARVDRVAFDKTGTLTAGRPQVTAIIGFERDETEVLRLAAALEAGSSHPIARAVLARAEADGVVVTAAENARAIGGRGVRGRVGAADVYLASPGAAAEIAPLATPVSEQIARMNDEGQTVSVLIVDGVVAGLIAVRDEPRADAAPGIADLVKLGASAVMLTGDNARTAAAIGARLGIAVRAEMLPADKQAAVREMRGAGRFVAKVGDGINDAPALAEADIGIAMGGGTDVALETADAAVLHGRVRDVADMIRLSRSALGNIRQNIAIALGLKAVFLVTTVAGITGLWPAILADTGATVLVTANAMRLLAWRPSRGPDAAAS